MTTSVIDTCILSLPPIELAHLFNGTYDTICLFKAESMLDYRGPILLHTLPNWSPTEPLEAELLVVCKDILDAYGETWDDYPSLCILGKAYIHSIKLYDQKSFKEDVPNHGNRVTLAEFQKSAGFGPDELVYGFQLHRIEDLQEPVIDVFPPEEVFSTTIWTPRTPMQMEAVKIAKKRFAMQKNEGKV